MRVDAIEHARQSAAGRHRARLAGGSCRHLACEIVAPLFHKAHAVTGAPQSSRTDQPAPPSPRPAIRSTSNTRPSTWRPGSRQHRSACRRRIEPPRSAAFFRSSSCTRQRRWPDVHERPRHLMSAQRNSEVTAPNDASIRASICRRRSRPVATSASSIRTKFSASHRRCSRRPAGPSRWAMQASSISRENGPRSYRDAVPSRLKCGSG